VLFLKKIKFAGQPNFDEIHTVVSYYL